MGGCTGVVQAERHNRIQQPLELLKTIVVDNGHLSSGCMGGNKLMLGENQWTPLIMNASWRAKQMGIFAK
jgi:hypothetical protein